jgi:hypothetical protein
VLEVADIVRAAGPQVCQQLAPLPSQRRTLQAILECRTPALGGQVYGCEHCGAFHYSYHSCGNRHCPKCHGQQTQRWLQEQRARLLPCPYYLATFTLPCQLRALARSHQKMLYPLLLSAAAHSLQTLCADPQWLGGQPAMTGVLHTWTRAMLYHPHAHFLVSAGGLSQDGQTWLAVKNPAFLVPVQALSKIFRAKFRAALSAAGMLGQVPANVWAKPWVVHVQPAGSANKVLEYLGRYVFRIAITHSRLESLENDQVTFRYRDNPTAQIKRVCLSAAQFVQRFLQHVLPKGLTKVRHYGLASGACQDRHATALSLLGAAAAQTPDATTSQPDLPYTHASADIGSLGICPHCRVGRLVCLGQIPPQNFRPHRRFPP